MARFNPPESLNFNNPSEWMDWKDRFSRFRLASKLHEDDESVQVSSLIYTMGKEAEHVFKSFVFDDARDKDKYKPVLKKFDEYFIPKRNVIHERAKFHQRVQLPGETVETFVRHLYEIAEHCEFADRNEQIRDRVVIGIVDKGLSEKLQLTPDLTLEKAIERARQSELVKNQMKDQASSSKLVDSVNKKSFTPGKNYTRGTNREGTRGRGNNTGRYSGYRHNNSRGQYSRQTPSGTHVCHKCNQTHQRNRCFAKGKRCYKCNGFDHFAVCCNSSSGNRREIHEVFESGIENDSALFLGSVTCADDLDAWTVNLRLYGKIVKFKIDSGADTSVMSSTTYATLKEPPELQPSKFILQGPGGKLKCFGCFTGKTCFKDKTHIFPIHVIEGNSTLLGRSAATALGLIQRVEEIDTSIFGSVGLVKCDPVKITLRQDSKPYCVTTARRVPFPLMSKVAKELKHLEDEGIIEKVERPMDWCAPMVPAIKSNGNVHICVDLKRLNEAVKREHYNLPNLDDISPKLVGATVSKLDA